MTARVSVLMPVHNGSRYVREACASILGQSYRDFELVVVDDGSTDDSRAQLAQLAQGDPRLRLVSREQRGLIATRNELLELARGMLVAWMDSDDCALPERLERQVAEFERRPSLVCLGSAVLEIDPDGWPITPVQFALDHETIGADLMQGGALRFPTVMMRRDHALQVGGFRQPFSIGEDLDMFLRLFEVGELANLPDVLLRYRQHLHSISHALGRHWPLYRDAILGLARERRNGGKDALQRGEAVELPRWTRSEVDPLWVYDQWARNALSAGNVQTARKYARRALREAPTSIASWKLVARVLLGHRGSVPT